MAKAPASVAAIALWQPDLALRDRSDRPRPGDLVAIGSHGTDPQASRPLLTPRGSINAKKSLIEGRMASGSGRPRLHAHRLRLGSFGAT
jgi:hypothetical protein